MTAIVLCIEGVPVSQKNEKQIMRNRKTGKPFIGTRDKVRVWKASAVSQLKLQWQSRAPLEGNLRADICIYQGARQAIDADNVLSSVLDALEQARIVNNDYQFSDGSWRRYRDRDRPRVEVSVAQINSGKM